MRFYLIACDIFLREIAPELAKSQHIFDVAFLEKGLHEDPANLRQVLQSAVDEAEKSKFRYDAILLAYALCGKSTSGLKARSVPIVIPKAHDCITLFLGSKARYAEEFRNHPGTYYYTAGAIERGGSAGADEAETQAKYEEYVKKYGEDNAKYLIEVEQGWLKHYTHAAYIRYQPLDFLGYDERTRAIARDRGLEYRELTADLGILTRLLSANWDENDFVIVPPGQVLTATDNEDILRVSQG